MGLYYYGRKSIKKVEYQKKYLYHAGAIMMKTWKYHDLLMGKFGKRKLALFVIINMEKDTELEKNTFSYAYKIRR